MAEKLRKLFWPGRWGGVPFSEKASEQLIKNTIKQGVDLALWERHTRPDGNDADAQGWVRQNSIQVLASEMYGLPEDLTELFRSVLKYRPYLSPEIQWKGKKSLEEVMADPGSGRIYGFAAVASPEMTPQQRLTTNAEDGICMVMSCDEWADELEAPTSTTTSIPAIELNVSGTGYHVNIYGDKAERPIGDPTTKDGDSVKDEQQVEKKDEAKKELAADDTTETAAAETPAVELATEDKDTTDDLAEREARLAARELEIKKAKIADKAADLNRAGKLHKDHVEQFCADMENYDDNEKDNNGLTALDRKLAFEAASRGTLVALGETATADKGGDESEPTEKPQTSAQLQLKKSLSFVAEKCGLSKEGAMDLSDEFDAMMAANPDMPPWEAFNEAARKLYGKDKG